MDIGVGLLSLSYERMLSADQKVSLILPVFVFFDLAEYEPDGTPNTFTYYYFTPGIKFYPDGQSNVTYALGPNLMFGYGGRTFSSPYSNQFPVKQRTFRLGLLVNNYFNFQIGPQVSFGITAGLGLRYLDQVKETYMDPNITAGDRSVIYNSPLKMTGQFSLSLGFWF